MPFLLHVHVHFSFYLCVNKIECLDLILKCDIVEPFLYIVINIDLNVSYYFDSLQKMIIDPINKI
jgi:hypothetical protein